MNPTAQQEPSLVLLASYPKSGITWLRCLLTAWSQGRLEHLGKLAAPPVLSLRQRFDEYTGIASADLSLAEIDNLRPRFHHALAEDLENPFPVKVHDRFYRNGAGEAVFGREACRGVVHVVRHPGAVAASYAAHLNRPLDDTIALMAKEDALHDWWPDAIDTRLPQRLGGWSGHALSWHEQAEIPRLTLRYEDLVREPERQFATLLEFAGLDPEPARVAKAVEATRFENLRALEEAAGFHERPGEGPFFRRGSADAWKSELGEERIERIVADHGAAMALFGYDRQGAA